MTRTHPPSIVAVAVVLALATPGPAAAADRVFGGYNRADGEPFGLELNAVGALVQGRIEYSFEARCPGGKALDLTDALPLVSAAITPESNALYATQTQSGSVHAEGTLDYRFGGLEAYADITVEGRIHGRRATGTFVARVGVFDPNTGRRLRTCRSGRKRWRATSAAGRVFAGATSNHRPVVVELRGHRPRIRRVTISSWARCSDGGFTTGSNEWTNLDVSPSGRFRASDPYAYRDGGTRYRGRDHVHGGFVHSQLHGRFSDSWTQTAPTTTCRTSVRWRARTTRQG